MSEPVNPREVETIYVDPEDRFIVSLVVGYRPELIHPDEFPATIKGACAAALDLTRDGGRDGTVWFVYDRVTRKGQTIEQGEFEDLSHMEQLG